MWAPYEIEATLPNSRISVPSIITSYDTLAMKLNHCQGEIMNTAWFY